MELENRMVIDSEWEDLERHTDWEEYYERLKKLDDMRYEDKWEEENL